ncbi:unnamed protein product [Adineta ricciae]|uniref:E3 ubiquitin-protein ligase n=1 Tax=Adineta ricciae TaxID=249248 RepID=A0A816CN48_ADIRI|nr:unnamed protein product [Adineta ricciae]
MATPSKQDPSVLGGLTRNLRRVISQVHEKITQDKDRDKSDERRRHPHSADVVRRDRRHKSKDKSHKHNSKSTDSSAEETYDSNNKQNDSKTHENNSENTEPERCAICMDDCIKPKRLNKCGHQFCTECIDQYFNSVKPQCPCCFTIYGDIRGTQPDSGTMKFIRTKHHLPGYEKSNGTIQITYFFPNGIQDDRHPNPGQPYRGTRREAYLPDTREGREILKLLQKAFELRQVFTIGQSRTTGQENVVTWNDIHHKTHYNGGVENFGYPDSTYLSRVRQELAAKGIQ